MTKTLGEYCEKYRHSTMSTVTIASLSNENVDVPAVTNINQKLQFWWEASLLIQLVWKLLMFCVGWCYWVCPFKACGDQIPIIIFGVWDVTVFDGRDKNINTKRKVLIYVLFYNSGTKN